MKEKTEKSGGMFAALRSKMSLASEEMSVLEYLSSCKEDRMLYASAAERMLKAIGEPEYVDTSKDEKLGRLFSNRTIKMYPAFREFYGMESTIEEIVGYFQQSAQGLEERKQILYLMGPVGGGKSSLAERIKELIQKEPIYVLKHGTETSPVFESPLGLFSEHKDSLESEYGIPAANIPACMSPWARKRLQADGGSVDRFSVVRVYPSIQGQVAVSKTEPGDDNNADISTLVGRIDMSKMGLFAQNDPDSYSYTGGLCLGNRGIMEFVEMFKAPIKVLHPLLTATQEGNYKGTQPIGAIPFDGIILAHSNESEWNKFVADKKNEAFLDRVCKIQVPYCLRVSEEKKIYEKYISKSNLEKYACAPQTLDLLAQFSVLTRLSETENSTRWAKMKVYDGENLKKTDQHAKSLQEYRDIAGIYEGMSGSSTRFAFKVLSKVFNYDTEEIAANPVHLLYVLEQEIMKVGMSPDQQDRYLDIIKTDLKSRYFKFLEDEMQKAYVESYSSYGQNLFDRYFVYADNWLQNQDYRNADTGEVYNRENLNRELEKIEKPAGIANPKDFRSEVVNYILRARAANGDTPRWDSYEKMRIVIEKKLFANTEELMPVVSFDAKSNKELQDKHDGFVERMIGKGYTPKQVRILVDWWNTKKNNN